MFIHVRLENSFSETEKDLENVFELKEMFPKGNIKYFYDFYSKV